MGGYNNWPHASAHWHTNVFWLLCFILIFLFGFESALFLANSVKADHQGGTLGSLWNGITMNHGETSSYIRADIYTWASQTRSWLVDSACFFSHHLEFSSHATVASWTFNTTTLISPLIILTFEFPASKNISRQWSKLCILHMKWLPERIITRVLSKPRCFLLQHFHKPWHLHTPINGKTKKMNEVLLRLILGHPSTGHTAIVYF